MIDEFPKNNRNIYIKSRRCYLRPASINEAGLAGGMRGSIEVTSSSSQSDIEDFPWC